MNLWIRKKKLWLALATALVVILALVTVCAVYVGDYYRADTAWIEAFSPANPVICETLEDGTLTVKPTEGSITKGFIFYPGGKVEHTAYLPLMKALASEGILCVLVEMPFRLAVLDMRAADGVQAQFPHVETWYIGGHSLGGSMAASYLEKHSHEFDGLILLGAYSTADLSGMDLSVLSIYGSEDGVMNREKYARNQSNFPEDYTEVILEGGNHAYFGSYGEQVGDGIATITPEAQISQTAKAILDMME